MTFEIAVERLFQPTHEGIRYTPGIGDPGGPTKFGISSRAYPGLDIKALTREKAKAIYKRDYWMPIRGDELPHIVAFQLFDFAVNSGPRAAIRALQRVLGVDDDGVLGPLTMHALETAMPLQTAMKLTIERAQLMMGLMNWHAAGRGWTTRLGQNLVYAAQDAA